MFFLSTRFFFFLSLIGGMILHGTPAFSQDKHLFELDNPDYTQESNQERYLLEQEFIAFAKETEKKPENYIRHSLKLLEINGENHDLINYRSNYMWYFYTYYYEEFKNPSGYLYDKAEVKKSYLQAHISRSPENIARLWGVFGGLIKEIASPCLKEGGQERKYVRFLIERWECISGIKKYGKKLDAIYLKLTDGSYYYDDVWTLLKPIMCKSTDNSYLDRFEYQSDKTWFYTFWVRRYHEGNADVVYTILKELLN